MARLTKFLHKKNGRFNVSATTRFDSDVPQTYFDPPYYKLRKPPVPTKQKRKDGIASAFVSNCGSRNNREGYLRNLTELLPDQIHSYGGCVNTKQIGPEVAGLSNWDAKMNISSSYRFAIVIENSIAEGYVTEKLYQILTAGAVPVYLGDPDILFKVPNRTGIILIDSFPTLEKLAEKLDQLMDDDKEYEKYLEWKKWPFQDTWVDVERMANAAWKCRVAMTVAGRPYKFRKAKEWGKTREIFEEKGDVFDPEAGEVCPTEAVLKKGGGGARGGWGKCRAIVAKYDAKNPPKAPPPPKRVAPGPAPGPVGDKGREGLPAAPDTKPRDSKATEGTETAPEKGPEKKLPTYIRLKVEAAKAGKGKAGDKPTSEKASDTKA